MKYIDPGENDVVLTVATDDADIYQTGMARTGETYHANYHANGFQGQAAGAFGQYILNGIES